MDTEVGVADEVKQPTFDPDRAIVSLRDDGRWSYRASALYSCTNALLAARLGIGGACAPPWLQDRFDEGKDQEPLIINKLANHFMFKVYGQQSTVEMLVGSNAVIEGHVDLLFTQHHDMPGVFITHRNGVQLGTMHDPYLLEWPEGAASFGVADAKALSKASTSKWLHGRFDIMPYYGWQQSIYQHGLALDGHPIPLVMAVKNKDTGEYFIEWFDEPYVGRADLYAKVLEVEHLATDEGDPALFSQKCEPVMFPCPYYFLHPSTDKARRDSTVDKDAANELATQLKAIKARREQAEADEEALKAQIVDLLGNKVNNVGVREVSEELSSVSTYHATVPGGIDWDRVKVDYPGFDPDDYKRPTRKSEKLSVRLNPKRK